MDASIDKFVRRMRVAQRRWQAGQLLCLAVRLAGLVAATLLGLGTLDYFLALTRAELLALEAAAVAWLLGVTGVGLTRTVRTTQEQTAVRLDTRAGSRRREVLSACDLTRRLAGEAVQQHDGLGLFLTCRAAEHATAVLDRVPGRAVLGSTDVLRRLRVAALPLVMVAGLAWLPFPATEVIFGRLRAPWADAPPWSRYHFQVSPSNPRVIYGGDIEIRALITGAPLTQPVLMTTRFAGQAHTAVCFQESGGRFAQHLENVIHPVEFRFQVGRARTPWLPVEVLLQPRIVSASVRITPPEYVRQPARELTLGQDGIAGLQDSLVVLDVTSNRPLSRGSLRLEPPDAPSQAQTIDGERTGLQQLRFAWKIRSTARLTLTVRDLQGTPNQDPLVVHQALVPDKPPVAALHEPRPLCLATPRAILPVAGYADDDFGLKSLHLGRGVVGYRDRLVTVALSGRATHQEVRSSLELGALGVEAGETLELFLEARDFNPALTGVGLSDIARIEIISEDDYAELLRTRTTIEEFAARYRVVEAEIQALRQVLKAGLDELRKGGVTPERAAELKRTMAEQNRRAQDLLRKLAQDFPVFDMEKALQRDLQDLCDSLEKDRQQLLDPATDNPGALRKAVADMLGRLESPENAVQQQIEDAEEVARIARVMECSGRFLRLVRRQTALVRNLQRFERDTHVSDSGQMAVLGREQAAIRAELEQLVSDLENRAKALPDTYPELIETSLEFARMLGKLEVPGLMQSATQAADNQNGERAHHFATLALERLRQMLSECGSSEFGSLCHGDLKFTVSESLRATLRQMLKRSLGKGGTGMGEGGAGEGTAGEGGYGTEGYSALNTPVYGPSRTEFAAAGSETGTGAGSGKGTAGTVARVQAETQSLPRQRDVRSRSVPIEKVPAKYREAVKRYFGPGGGQ